MLKSLEVKNYALIENLHIDFQAGFTIITGQTGSGKSVLLQALALALGERADHGALRNPQEKCVVEAIFDVKDYDLGFEDSMLIIRRVIAPGGKSRIFLNDEPTKLEKVQTIGRKLVDIHSQHQHLLLKDEGFTFNLLDQLGGHKDLLHRYEKDYQAYKQQETDYKALVDQIERNRADYDYLKHQLSEFEGLDLEQLDLASLEAEHKLQSGGAEVQHTLQEVQGLLDQGVEVLATLESQTANLEKSLPQGAAWHERAQTSLTDMTDLHEEVRRSSSNFEYDPARATEIESILSKIYALQKRYQVFDIKGLIDLKADLEGRIASVDNFDLQEQSQAQALEQAKDKLFASGRALTTAREKASDLFLKRVSDFLPALGMGESALTLNIQPKPEPTVMGLDSVVIHYAPHANMTAKPLASIASGGELSRIMLILKVILADHTTMPTILLDEIDIGVSGSVAESMGSLMKQMSQSRQVMAITHLAQVAGKGDHHIKIFKESDSLAAYTKMRTLNREDRIEEIAGLLSGSDITENAIEQARRLLG